MTSLPKTVTRFGPPRNQTNYNIIRKVLIDKCNPKMYFLLNLSLFVKSYGHFCQTLALFTMLTHQIWSCHVTQDANFKKIFFCPNSTFTIRKSQKISSGKALYFRSYQPKTSRVFSTPTHTHTHTHTECLWVVKALGIEFSSTLTSASRLVKNYSQD